MPSKWNAKIGQQVMWLKPENRVFILGGFTQDNSPPFVWEFILKTKKLIQLTKLDKGRMNFGCEAFDGMIYLVGGLIQISNTPSATWMRYIVKHNKFEEISLLNKKRQGIWLWEFNSTYLYAFGGQRVRSSAKTSIERIKFSQMRISTYWEEIEFDLGSLEPDNYISWVPLNETEIMIFGGQKNNLKYNEVYVYDVDLNILVKDDDCPLKQADFFEMKNYIYTDNRRKITIAGAYYIHQFDKFERSWTILGKSIFHKYMRIHNLQVASSQSL